MRRTRFRSLWLAAALLIPIVTACKDESLVGTYTATLFTFSPTGDAPTNVLTAGGSINLVIASNLTTSGTMVLPASVTGTVSTSVSLLGSAVRQGDIVTLQLVTDTFLRDMQFAFDGTALSGTGTFNGGAVGVTLSK